MASDDILDQGLEDYKAAKDHWQDIFEKAEDDLNFLSDKPLAQWDPVSAASRTTVGRPTVEIDQLSQFVHQVSNDIRQNTPAIHVIPSDEDTDTETAEMIQGRVKAIEYKSNADAAYDMAADFSVKSSIGFIRVDHDYISSKGFEQEIRIKRVINPKAYLIDPASIEPDGSDAKFGFVLDTMTVKAYKKQYPGFNAISFGEETPPAQSSDMVTIAEYFYIDEKSEDHGMLEDGSSEPVVDGKAYKTTRSISTQKVMRCWLSGSDVLEKPSKFPGKYIPIIPVYGEESWINGKRHLLSLIRKSKSSQMMYNELKSSETEILIKQLQAPVQAAVGQMRGFEDDWKTPDKAMVLYYHQTDSSGQPAPAPQRLQPPAVSAGFANASQDAENNIRKTLGMYNAGVGQREGQASGIALKQLEMSGDTASLHFGDNLNRSVAQVGRVVVSMLPEIEDTARAVSIIGKEDELKTIGINGHTVEGQKRSYDFRKGEYDVRVVAGPSFTTQRQEAAANYSDIVGKMPDLMPVIGDLVFKYQDSPGAQAISNRLKKLVDPKLLDESERPKPEDGQPNPEVQQLTEQATQVMQAAQQQIQQLQTELQQLEQQVQTDGIKAQQAALKEQTAALKDQQRITELEIENSLLKAKAEIATPEEKPAQKPLPDGLQITKTQQQLELEDAMQQRELSAMEQMQLRQMQADAERQAMQQQRDEEELQFKAMQSQAIIQAVASMKQSVDGLTSAVLKPKVPVYNPDGTIARVN